MRTETKFIRNYLSSTHFKYGVESVLLVLGLCVLASAFYWDPTQKISSYLSASYDTVLGQGEYWRLFTTSFVHGDLKHLLSNSLMLGFLTYFVSSYYGVFVSVLLSFSVATLTNLFVIQIYGGSIGLVGASGVVYYLWGFWMILYILLQRQYSFIKRSLRMGAVFLIILVPTEYQPSTSYLAHGVGFALGLVVGAFYYLLNKSKLLQKEEWEIIEKPDELTDLDIIALLSPTEEERTLHQPESPYTH